MNCYGIGEHDVVIIGGGVAGYVAAIKAGQAGLKVRRMTMICETTGYNRHIHNMGLTHDFAHD